MYKLRLQISSIAANVSFLAVASKEISNIIHSFYFKGYATYSQREKLIKPFKPLQPQLGIMCEHSQLELRVIYVLFLSNVAP